LHWLIQADVIAKCKSTCNHQTNAGSANEITAWQARTQQPCGSGLESPDPCHPSRGQKIMPASQRFQGCQVSDAACIQSSVFLNHQHISGLSHLRGCQEDAPTAIAPGGENAISIMDTFLQGTDPSPEQWE